MASLLDDMFKGIEDEDVELEDGNDQPLEGADTVNPAGAEDAPRRLKKAREVEQNGNDASSPTIETPGMETAVQPSQQQTEEEGEENSGEEEAMGDEYWDEEDEIEQYFQLGGGNGNEEDSDGEESENVALELVAGDGTMRGTMDAETQRLLRGELLYP